MEQGPGTGAARATERDCSNQKEVERCRLEQARCRDTILGLRVPEPWEGTAEGAWDGMEDWFKEELLIEIEQTEL
jgi:hypothetical protein